MSYLNGNIQVYQVVDSAVGHTWSVPEFQRGFVWKATQVRDLADSLWLGYPVGSILLWNSNENAQERIAIDGQRPQLWLVDGQQRATALAILFGRKPYWWNSAEDWHKTLSRYDIRFDIEASQAPYFLVANAIIRANKQGRYIPLRDLLNMNPEQEESQQKISDLVTAIKNNDLCKHLSDMAVGQRIAKVCRIRNRELIAITIDHDLEDVVEIFSRLNSKGTRVTEADIYLGIVASRAPGWVRDEFLPYLKKLADVGFDIDPNLLFRTLTAVGAKKVRFKEIDPHFWDSTTIQPVWTRTKKAWEKMIHTFQDYGILSNSLMPSNAALVTMVALFDQFSKKSESRFEQAIYWFLQASRFGRYSTSPTTALDEDLRAIQSSKSQQEALQTMIGRFQHLMQPIDEEFFMRDYSDARFGRFLLYILVYHNQAIDWDDRGHRIGFDEAELLQNFKPEWHHIFPRKFLEGKVDEEKIEALANIAVIGPEINIRISAKDPMDYVRKYNITREKLSQQFIDDNIKETMINQYESWLRRRARKMAKAANTYLNNLQGDL